MANYVGNTYRVNVEFRPDPTRPPSSLTRTAVLIAAGQPADAEGIAYLQVCGCTTAAPLATSAAGTPPEYQACIGVPVPAGADLITVYAVQRIESSEDAVAISDGTPFVYSVTLDPGAVTVLAGNSQQFSARVYGSDPATTSQEVLWSISGNTDNTTNISASGLLTVGGNETAMMIVVRATSQQEPLRHIESAVNTWGTAPVTYAAVEVNPIDVYLLKGRTAQFVANVEGTGARDMGVTWSISGNTDVNTFISTDGELSLGPQEQNGSHIVVTATSDGDSTLDDSVGVTVGELSVAIEPVVTSVAPGSETSFIATVDGVNGFNRSVTWTLTGNNAPSTTLSADGVLRVDLSETGSLVVKATADEDGTTYAYLPITVRITALTSISIPDLIVNASNSWTVTFTPVSQGDGDYQKHLTADFLFTPKYSGTTLDATYSETDIPWTLTVDPREPFWPTVVMTSDDGPSASATVQMQGVGQFGPYLACDTLIDLNAGNSFSQTVQLKQAVFGGAALDAWDTGITAALMPNTVSGTTQVNAFGQLTVTLSGVNPGEEYGVKISGATCPSIILPITIS